MDVGKCLTHGNNLLDDIPFGTPVGPQLGKEKKGLLWRRLWSRPGCLAGDGLQAHRRDHATDTVCVVR